MLWLCHSNRPQHHPLQWKLDHHGNLWADEVVFCIITPFPSATTLLLHTQTHSHSLIHLPHPLPLPTHQPFLFHITCPVVSLVSSVWIRLGQLVVVIDTCKSLWGLEVWRKDPSSGKLSLLFTPKQRSADKIKFLSRWSHITILCYEGTDTCPFLRGKPQGAWSRRCCSNILWHMYFRKGPFHYCAGGLGWALITITTPSGVGCQYTPYWHDDWFGLHINSFLPIRPNWDLPSPQPTAVSVMRPMRPGWWDLETWLPYINSLSQVTATGSVWIWARPSKT